MILWSQNWESVAVVSSSSVMLLYRSSASSATYGGVVCIMDLPSNPPAGRSARPSLPAPRPPCFRLHRQPCPPHPHPPPQAGRLSWLPSTLSSPRCHRGSIVLPVLINPHFRPASYPYWSKLIFIVLPLQYKFDPQAFDVPLVGQLGYLPPSKNILLPKTVQFKCYLKRSSSR